MGLRIILIWVFAFIASSTFGARLSGVVHGANNMQFLQFSKKQAYVSGTPELINIPLYKGGVFDQEIDITIPTIAIIQIGNKKLPIYLENNVDLEIDIELQMFPGGVLFKGPGAKNQEVLQYFLRMQPIENVADRVSLEAYHKWFPVDRRVQAWLQMYGPEQFVEKLNEHRNDCLTVLDGMDGLTANFSSFINTEIQSYFAFNLIMYYHNTMNRYHHQASFLDQIQAGPWQTSGQIASENYRYYLSLQELAARNGSILTPELLKERMEYASTIPNTITRQYIQSELLISGMKLGFPKVSYAAKRFLNDNPDAAFMNRIELASAKIQDHKVGERAPAYNLTDVDGNEISSEALKGKVVYINFWANWCQPCIAKMENLEKAIAKIDQEKVVILHLSIDENKADWEAALQRIHVSGHHIHLGENHPLAKQLKVQSLPDHFIISQKGEFGPKPLTSNMDYVVQLLMQMASES